MPILNIFPRNTKFKFMSLRKIAILFSISFFIVSFISIFIQGLNFGIDFTGGVLIELRSKNEIINLTDLRGNLNKLNIGEVQLQTIGSDNDIAIRVQKGSGDDKQLDSIKKIKNEVAGNTDILLVPNVEAGNALVKMMIYFMSACAAGVVIGGKAPVVITSRADESEARLASIAAAIVALD